MLQGSRIWDFEYLILISIEELLKNERRTSNVQVSKDTDIE